LRSTSIKGRIRLDANQVDDRGQQRRGVVRDAAVMHDAQRPRVIRQHVADWAVAGGGVDQGQVVHDEEVGITEHAHVDLHARDRRAITLLDGWQ
jgi:hypothetical protein